MIRRDEEGVGSWDLDGSWVEVEEGEGERGSWRGTERREMGGKVSSSDLADHFLDYVPFEETREIASHSQVDPEPHQPLSQSLSPPSTRPSLSLSQPLSTPSISPPSSKHIGKVSQSFSPSSALLTEEKDEVGEEKEGKFDQIESTGEEC